MMLSNVQPGSTVIVTGYDKGGHACRAKLLALGLTRGTKINVVGIAPMGDPLHIELRGFHLTLRHSEADHVKVKLF